MATSEIPAVPKQRMLDLVSAWPLWVGLLLALVVVGWRVSVWIEGWRWEHGEIPGLSVTNGFDLTSAIVPIRNIVHSGFPIDALKSLDDPMHITPEQMNSDKQHRNFLADSDRVIGVTLGGESCAYPLRQLNWHEISNDNLGGIPIAVTYSSLADSARVFDRRVQGETVEFRYSGLLLHSCLLFYDARETPEARSLWSQLEDRAIPGPAAKRGERLTTYEATILPFGEWRQLRPDTLVTEGYAQLYKKCYKQNPDEFYVSAGRPRFPVVPEPPADSYPPLTKLLAVQAKGVERLFFYPDIARRAGASGLWETAVGDQPIRIRYQSIPECAWVEPQGEAAGIRANHALWFAFYASRGGKVPISGALPDSR